LPRSLSESSHPFITANLEYKTLEFLLLKKNHTHDLAMDLEWKFFIVRMATTLTVTRHEQLSYPQRLYALHWIIAD
jgi:hypothetical protein